MKTIQMTIDDDLLIQVDEAISELDMNRSAFIRTALYEALRRHRIRKLEERHAAGYSAQPATPNETLEWTSEQTWENA